MSIRILDSLEYSSELARYLLSRGGLAWSPTAHDLLTRPLTGTPRRAISPGRGHSNPLHLSLGEWPRLPFTARDILTHPTPSVPRRALVPGEHSFTVRVLRARRAPGRSLLPAGELFQRSAKCPILTAL